MDFTNLADKKLSEVEKPKPLPLGTYEALIDGLPKFGEAKFKDKDTGEAPPVITFTYRLVSPTDDVDADDLAAMGGLMGKNGKPRTINQDFICNGGEVPYSVRRYLESFGTDSEMSLREALESVAGQPVLVTIKHRMDEKSGDRYAQVERAVANV